MVAAVGVGVLCAARSISCRPIRDARDSVSLVWAGTVPGNTRLGKAATCIDIKRLFALSRHAGPITQRVPRPAVSAVLRLCRCGKLLDAMVSAASLKLLAYGRLGRVRPPRPVSVPGSFARLRSGRPLLFANSGSANQIRTCRSLRRLTRTLIFSGGRYPGSGKPSPAWAGL